MLRGRLSNRPQYSVGIDYRILFEVTKSSEWLNNLIPKILLETRFETAMKKVLPVREDAIRFMAENAEYNFTVFSVGVPIISRAIDMRSNDYVFDSIHFEGREDFRFWLRSTRTVLKAFTTDPTLIGIGDLTVMYNGWADKV